MLETAYQHAPRRLDKHTKYIYEYTMPTSVHIPPPLLQALDRKARALRVSRNRVIVDALERDLAAPTGWSEQFFHRLSDTDAPTSADVEDMQRAITAARTRKRAPRL